MSAARRLTALAAVCVLAVAGWSLPSAVGQSAAPSAVPPVSASAAAAKPSLRLWTDCVTRVNAARAAAGRVALTLDSRLATAATTHSTYQAQIQKMTHVGTGGTGSTNGGDRITAAGFTWSGWAENVAAGQGDCASVVSAWLGSPSHRTNILNSSYRYIGVGNVVGANGVHYWTMDLAV